LTLKKPHQSGFTGSYLLSYRLLSALRLSLNPIQTHQTDQNQNATYYHLQLLVGVNICLVYFTHLYINPGFVIKRVFTLYVLKTGNLSMSVVSSSIKKQSIT
jgi:hypothetical protein